jgi:transposase
VVGETLRAALNALATAAPAWLREHSQPAWLERYAVRIDVYRLPKSEAGREALAVTIGADGHALLAAAFAPAAPAWLRTLPAVETLRQVWVQQFCIVDDQVRWRQPGDQPPPGRRLHSPYDPEAVCGTKRGQRWIGYKVHLTETCDADQPHLIVDVRTTTAAVTDTAMTGPIHHTLAARGLLPSRHLVDSGYIDARLLVASRGEHGIELMGPARPDTSWLQQAGAGFDIGAFAIDWESHTARCPQGRTSTSWTVFQAPQAGIAIRIGFDPATCRACPCRASCTRSQTGPRTLALLPQAQHEAVQARPVGSSRPKPGSRLTRNGLAWKGCSRRGCGHSGCAAAATSVRPRPICSMCSPRWRSTSSGWMPGCGVSPLPPPGSPALPP